MGFWESFLGFDPNRKRAFPGQQPGEEVIYMGVCHWIKLVPFFFYLTGAILLLVFLNKVGFFDDLTPFARFTINSSSVALFIHILCFRLYNYFLKVMLITNFRLIDIRHDVFLHREREIIPLNNIQDIRYQQNGILSRLFKYGDLYVLGSSSSVQYTFHYVPRVSKIHHILGETYQKVLRDYQRREQQALHLRSSTALPDFAPKH